MNRHQFLTELNQYLTFFSPEERAKIVADYTEKFDAAGEEGESALLLQLGTPMIAAIDLKRRKEAGETFVDESGKACADKKADEDESLSSYNVETETYESITQDDTDEKEPQPSAPPLAGLTEAPAKKRTSQTKFVLAVIGATLLSIPIALLFLALASAGGMLIVSMGYLILTGLKSLYYVTDALLLFGGGLFSGGLGLLIIWFAVWSAISLISKLYRGACALKPDIGGKECDA